MNTQEFYNQYAKNVLTREGYPLRARSKARLLFAFASQTIAERITKIADFGGCYGYCLAEFQKLYERHNSSKCSCAVYELGEDYLKIGPKLFPEINFAHPDNISQQKNDLSLLCDVLEHVADFDAFLSKVKNSTNFVLIWSPIEMSVLRKLAIFLKLHPKFESGFANKEGHINFWGVNETLQIVRKHFKILKIGYSSYRSMKPEDGLDCVSKIDPLRFAVKWLSKGLSEKLYVKLIGGHLMVLGQAIKE